MTNKQELEAVRRFLLGLADFFELLVPKLRDFAGTLKFTNSKRRGK